MNNKGKKLYRSRTDRILFGICSGLGEYFGIDAVIVRVVFVILSLINGFGVLLYLILLAVVPREPRTSESGSRKEKVKDFVEEVKETTESVAEEIRDEVKSIKEEFKKKD